MASIIALMFIAPVLLSTAPNPSPSPDSSKPGCADELVAISPCLGYVAAGPNNITDSVTTQCCEVFSKAFNSPDGNCYCYLVTQPSIFGFPLNESRVLKLPTLCASGNGGAVTDIGESIRSMCSESPPLPPLQGSAADVEIAKPPALDQHNGSSPSASRPTLALDQSSVPATPLTPAIPSSTGKHIRNWFLPGASLAVAIYLFNYVI
ncbi:hypothetical protein M5689_005823 [Euphorbia peplus]|nr:hypothetical protein M5689_005823 [Euphorbia peplus]